MNKGPRRPVASGGAAREVDPLWENPGFRGKRLPFKIWRRGMKSDSSRASLL
jgi:hypothetical protein